MQEFTEDVSKSQQYVVGGFFLLGEMSLAFMVMVIFVASMTFLFGGHCAVWQWWVCIGATIFLGLSRSNRTRTERHGGCVWFLGLLLVTWLLAGAWATLSNYDFYGHHSVSVRLLAEGWNPVWAGASDKLAAAMDVDPNGMHLWHVLSGQKAAWIFCAVAYLFTGTPFNLFFPVTFFLLPPLICQFLKLSDGMSRWLRVLLTVVLVVMSLMPNVVDVLACGAGFGLLMTMVLSLRHSRLETYALLLFSFLMMTAKSTALLGCFIFWALFTAVFLWRSTARLRHAIRIALIGLGLTGAFLITCASPYFTSWRNFGHPLYPAVTVDEARFPAVNITQDFSWRNDDARALGYVGSVCNAYVSPWLTQRFWGWLTDKPDFRPECMVWRQGKTSGEPPSTPTSAASRRWLLISLATLFIIGGMEFRFMGGCMLLTMLLVPVDYIGYVRYQPWLSLLPLAALAATAIRFKIGYPRLLIRYGVALCALWLALPKAVSRGFIKAQEIEIAASIQRVLESEPIEAVYSANAGISPEERAKIEAMGGAPFREMNPPEIYRVNFALLCRQEPRLRPKKIGDIAPDGAVGFPSAEFTFDAKNKATAWSEFARFSTIEDRKQRLMRYPVFVAKSYCLTAPRLIFARVRGLLPNS